ncbi:hypothetical protein Tco_1268460, partial [Tanacetum coccineum]
MSIYDFMTFSSWGDAKVVEVSHHLFLPLLEHVSSHTTAREMEGAMISLPTPDEIVASLPDLRLAKKFKGPAQVRVCLDSDVVAEPSRPSKKRKVKKKASVVYSIALEFGHAEGMNEANLTDFCAEIEDSLDKDESTSTRVGLAPIPRLCKRLGAPPSMAVVIASKPSHVGTSVHASTFGRSLSLEGAIVSGHILEDDFGTATRGEEINLTLFPLTPGPYQMSYPYEGASSPPYTREEWNDRHAPEANILCKDIYKDPDVCRKSLDRTITPAKLKRTESLFPLDLANRFNVLSALLVSHGAELNSRYTSLVTVWNRIQEKFDRKAGYVKVLRSKVTNLAGKLERMQKDCNAWVQENMQLHSQKDAASDKVKELQIELTDARVASIGLSEELSQIDAKLSDQDVVDVLREEVTRFDGSGVESLVRKLLSSDEFHAALACVASLGINYDVQRIENKAKSVPCSKLSRRVLSPLRHVSSHVVPRVATWYHLAAMWPLTGGQPSLTVGPAVVDRWTRGALSLAQKGINSLASVAILGLDPDATVANHWKLMRRWELLIDQRAPRSGSIIGWIPERTKLPLP